MKDRMKKARAVAATLLAACIGIGVLAVIMLQRQVAEIEDGR